MITLELDLIGLKKSLTAWLDNIEIESNVKKILFIKIIMKKKSFFSLSSCNVSSMLKLCLCILSFSLLSYCATQNIFFFSISAKFTRLCRKWVAHIVKSTEKRNYRSNLDVYYTKPIF